MHLSSLVAHFLIAVKFLRLQRENRCHSFELLGELLQGVIRRPTPKTSDAGPTARNVGST